MLAEARQMADLGYSEIQLLGQNVNSYKDSAGKKTFAELLAAVGAVPGIKRVRFTTSHPAISDATSSTPSTPSPLSAITFISPCKADQTACSMPCSASTLANNISSASLG